jgi:hypothetical protein
MSFNVKDSLGNELSPGDIVVYGERWGRVSVGVVFDKVFDRDGDLSKIRVKAPEDKGKSTPWGNTRIKSLSVYLGKCREAIKLDATSTYAKVSEAKILSDYMEEKNKIVRVKKLRKLPAIKIDDSALDMLSSLGAPKI